MNTTLFCYKYIHKTDDKVSGFPNIVFIGYTLQV